MFPVLAIYEEDCRVKIKTVTKQVLLQLFITGAALALGLAGCSGGGGAGGTSTPTNANPSGLSAPTAVNAIAGDGQVTVSWASVAGATSYYTYVGTSSNVSTSNFDWKTSATGSPEVILGLQNGMTHWVIVTAIDATSESGASSAVQFTPSIVPVDPVTDLTAVPGNNSVTLQWTAVANATDYQIQHGTDANFVSGVSNLQTGSTSYTFSNLVNGITYFYRIRAINNSSQSSYSPAVSATPNYMPGWNGMIEIASLPGDIWTDLYSRTDNLNSNRDALCTWIQGKTVYATTYTKTTDWVPSVAISTSGVVSSSSLSENGEGAVIWAERVYTDTTNTTYHDDIVVKHYQADVWGVAIQLSGAESGTYARDPEIMLDKDGNGVAAWHGNDGNFYVRTYDRATNVWSATSKVNTGINPAVDGVRIGVDATGGFVLAWNEGTATSTSLNGVFLRKYSKAGGWGITEKVNLDDPALDAYNGIDSLSVNVNGDIFVLWEHSPAATDHQMILRRYAAATATWGNPIVVDASSGYVSWGKVKSNSSTNAIISWDRSGSAGSTVDLKNFAVYSEATGSIGPIEQLPASDINTVDIATDAANSFRMLYALTTGPTHAYERIYNVATQTWDQPAVINDYFGNDNFIATVNAVGEMMLTTSEVTYDSFTYNRRDLVRAKFYLP